jgi:hypothetical protein
VSRLCAREDSDVSKLGITAESTGRRRDRLYTYRKQLQILDGGPE